MRGLQARHTILLGLFLSLILIIPPFFIKKFEYLVFVQLLSSMVIFLPLSSRLTKSMNSKSKAEIQTSNVLDEVKFNETLRASIFNAGLSVTENDSKKNLDNVLNGAISMIDAAEAGSLALIKDDGSMEFVAANNFDLDVLKTADFDFTDSFLYNVSMSHISSPIIVENVRKNDSKNLSKDLSSKLEYASHFKVMSSLTAPIYKDDKLVGMISLDSPKSDVFTENHKNIINYFAIIAGISMKFKDLLLEKTNLTRTDRLTGIFNRSYFEERFIEFQDESYKTNKPFAFVMIDLNNIKAINDSFGRVYGDLTLVRFANIVKEHLKEGDIFARFGGDEFILIFNNTTKQTAETRLKEIHAVARGHEFEYMSKKIPMEFSYGISYCPDESMILDILIKISDNRMHKQKQIQKAENIGKSEYESFSNLTREVIMEIESVDINNKL